MMGKMAGMMKKVQEMQSGIEALNNEMAETEFSASVGGGAVSVTLTGKGKVLSVDIDPESDALKDIEMLGDMIRLAMNNARDAADETMAARMKEITAGMPIPPGMQLPI